MLSFVSWFNNTPHSTFKPPLISIERDHISVVEEKKWSSPLYNLFIYNYVIDKIKRDSIR